jgi:hypothetical protein
MRGLLNMRVSFGLAADITMTPADTMLGKRAAADDECTGDRTSTKEIYGLDGNQRPAPASFKLRRTTWQRLIGTKNDCVQIEKQLSVN